APLVTGVQTCALPIFRPNPKARLYTRVIVDPPHLDRAVAVVNTLRAIRTLHEAVGPTDSDWKDIAREALRALGDAERASTARFEIGRASCREGVSRAV